MANKSRQHGTQKSSEKTTSSQDNGSAATSSANGSIHAVSESTGSGKENVTGIWKGYFEQNTLSFVEDKYRFEVQVADNDNHSLKAVTYSYKTTVFYGKAEATGIFTAKSKNFLLKEIKLTDLKLQGSSEACLMTCYLDYDKIGSLETLSGTYTSVNVKDKSDCGSGRVYLEKSPVTDFYKEDFLVKRENELKNRSKTTPTNSKNTVKAHKPGAASHTLASAAKKTKVKPGAETNIVTKSTTTTKPAETTPIVPKPQKADPSPATPVAPTPQVKKAPQPEILKKRSNEMVKTIVTGAKEFKIDLYDNGEIDGDRISVYHNNELIVSNKQLTDKPISFTIQSPEGENTTHDFVLVAENLGTIPPNTSLMIITAGSNRYELFLTSTEQKNAMVRVEYKPESNLNK